MRKLLCCLTLGLTAIGCGGNPEIPKAGAQTTGDQAQVQTLLDKADALNKALENKDQLSSAIAAYEEVTKLAPGHKAALLQLTRLYNLYAFYSIKEGDRDQRMAAYLKGREMALRALATDPEFRAAYEKNTDIVKDLPLVKAENMPALYWFAVNWAQWGELYGIIRSAIDIPKVKAMMDKINEVAPEFYGHAADRFFVGYWVAIPGFAGKDPKKSQAAYDRCLPNAANFLDNTFTYARYYAKDADDRKLFESKMHAVVDAPADAPDYPFHLENNLDRVEAKTYLAKAKELFE